jgi:KilA-N domain
VANSRIIVVKDKLITIIKQGNQDYISLTDIARNKNMEEPKDVVKNWMRSRTTIEFLGLWEQLYNANFKGVEFDSLLFEAGSNSFTLSPSKWINYTNAIGIITKAGNNGGTYSHKDIAFEFASWVSSGFKLYLIKEFQRLKEEENEQLKLEWNLQRILSKINYRIHTDAIKDELIPPTLTLQQRAIVYANEGDVLNMALFGQTAAQWRANNKGKTGNIRDNASLEQLVVLSNLESINSVLIRQGISKPERLQKLNEIAISQIKSLLNSTGIQKLK